MFLLTIVELDKVIFKGEAESATLPGKDGELTVLENHIPLITPLKQGTIKVKNGKEDLSFGIKDGILEVKPKETIVLVTP